MQFTNGALTAEQRSLFEQRGWIDRSTARPAATSVARIEPDDLIRWRPELMDDDQAEDGDDSSETAAANPAAKIITPKNGASKMPATKPRPTVDERQAFRQVFDSLVTSHMANNRRCNRQRAIRVVAQREPGLYAKYLAAISPPHMANDY